MSQNTNKWRPEQKVAAGAIAAILVWVAQLTLGLDVPPGIEAAVAVLVSYLVPAGSPGEESPVRTANIHDVGGSLEGGPYDSGTG